MRRSHNAKVTISAVFQAGQFQDVGPGFYDSDIIVNISESLSMNDYRHMHLSYQFTEGVHFCIYDILCSDSNDFMDPETAADGFDPTQQTLDYGATVQYTCGDGQIFYYNNGTESQTQDFTCNWEGNWEPQDTLASCKCKSEMVLG